jgi:hypothetical protein
MKRSYSRVVEPHQSSVAYEDDLQHFVQDCWHLKDWIRNDPATGIGSGIESRVKTSRALMVTADLANGAKHLARHTDRVGAYVTSTSVTVHLGQSRPADITYIITLADGSTLTAGQVAHEANRDWDAILNDIGLL